MAHSEYQHHLQLVRTDCYQVTFLSLSNQSPRMTHFATLPSIEELTTDYRARCIELSKDLNNLLPDWARQESADLFKKRKLVICGSLCRSEIRVLAKTA